MARNSVWEFNKGEWTEAYVFLKLLGDGRVYGATADFCMNQDVYIDIINILRSEGNNILKFERVIQDVGVNIEASENDAVFKIVTAPELSEKAEFLYDAIRGIGSNKAPVPAIQEYLESLHFSSPKASLSDDFKNRYGDKSDVIITKEESSDHARSTEGFSIKSHLGKPPTFFNCSQTSGFRYLIEGCSEADMYDINAKDEFLAILKEIKDKRFSLKYDGCRSDVFYDNITIVDSRMDEIMAEAVLLLCGASSSGNSASSRFTTDIAAALAASNPLRLRPERAADFYNAKLKDFLFDAFSGLTASTPWDGRRRMTGGYIDVDGNGQILYYRAMSDDIFCTYLFDHTYMDRPDRGVVKNLSVLTAQAKLDGREPTEEELYRASHKYNKDGSPKMKNGKHEKKEKKGDFGYVYEKDGNCYIDINFQVRFS